MYMRQLGIIMMMCLSVVLWNCSGNTLEEGIVAKVNGKPITLNRLEAKYDFLHLGWSDSLSPPTVGWLKDEYGRILSDLIVQELVAQELDERGLSVTDKELEKAEAEIKSDYPEGAFEQVLIEEYIDISLWREELRARLALDKFLQEVLRSEIKLDYQEAEAYYKEHITDFYLPPRVRFLQITGAIKKDVAKAVADYQKNHDLEHLDETYEGVTARELKVREDRLPDAWRDVVDGLEEGAAAEPESTSSGFEALILLERVPGKVLDPSRAYPLVESVLLEKKLQESFNEWLEDELENAEILITSHLLPDYTPEEETEYEDYEEEDAMQEEPTREDLMPEYPNPDELEPMADDNPQ